MKFCRFFKFISLLTILINVFCSYPTLAQDNSDAFTTMKLGIDFVKNSNDNLFHEYWVPGQGLEVYGQMPFYFGQIEGGIHFVPYENRVTVPEFLSFYYYLAWGESLSFPKHFSWYNGSRIGSYNMKFDDTKINETQRSESELCFGLQSKISYLILCDFEVELSAIYLKVFTYKRVELAFISAGLSYHFSTPLWIREIFE